MTNNKIYLLCTMCRSKDQFHDEAGIVHLVSSVFYTHHLDVSQLKLINLNCAHKNILIIFRFYNSREFGYNFIEISDNIFIFEFSFLYFIELYLKSGMGLFDQFILTEVKNKLGGRKNILEDVFNQVLFIFEDINWFGLQLLFKNFNIRVSGGSDSRRHLLSTSDFMLSWYLCVLGYTSQNIYESYTSLNKMISKQKYDDYVNFGYRLERMFMSQQLEKYFLSEIDLLTNFNNELSQYIHKNDHEIALYEQKMKQKNNKINNDYNNFIKIRKDFIHSWEVKISENNKNISLWNIELKNLDRISYSDMKSLYLKYCHNNLLKTDSLKFKKELTLIKNQIKKFKLFEI